MCSGGIRKERLSGEWRCVFDMICLSANEMCSRLASISCKTTANDAGNPLVSRLPELCGQSDALYATCPAPSWDLWKAYRLAGVFTIRHPISCLGVDARPEQTRVSVPITGSPSTRVLVLQILSCLDAIIMTSSEPDEKTRWSVSVSWQGCRRILWVRIRA